MKLSVGKKLAGLAVSSVVIAGAGTMAWANGSGGSPTASASTPGASQAATKKAAGGGLAILRRADHGDVEIKVPARAGGTATWQTVTFDRGKVSDIAADHITLARPDGKSITLRIDAATRYRGVTSWQTVVKSNGAIVISRNGVATDVIEKGAGTAAAAP